MSLHMSAGPATVRNALQATQNIVLPSSTSVGMNLSITESFDAAITKGEPHAWINAKFHAIGLAVEAKHSRHNGLSHTNSNNTTGVSTTDFVSLYSSPNHVQMAMRFAWVKSSRLRTGFYRFLPINTPRLAAFDVPRVLKSQAKAKDCLVQYSSVGWGSGKSCEFVTLSTYNPTVGCGILAWPGIAEARFLWHE